MIITGIIIIIVMVVPLFSLIRDFRKQNTHGNVSKISVSLAFYRQIGSKSTINVTHNRKDTVYVEER